MAILPTDIRILFTNYDIITYFLNLASCSEHFISIKHRILATFNINKKIQFRQPLIKLFYWIFVQKIINCQFSLLWHWKCLKKVHLLDLHIETIHLLFYNYVFNSSQKITKHLVINNQLFPLLKYMINRSWHVIFHIIPFISTSYSMT